MMRSWWAIAFGILPACGDASPPLGQIVLYVDTDAPVPGATDTPPLFDALRVDVYPPGQADPCAKCSRTFDVDSTKFEKLEVSLGIVTHPGTAGYRARVRLYSSNAALSGEPPGPNADGTPSPVVIEAVVALPPVAEDGIVRRSIFLPTESVGRPIGTLDIPIASTAGAPTKSRVGTWPGAKRVPCNGDPADGEVCIPGGAFWMGNPRVLPTEGDVARQRLVVLSPFFIDADEATVGALRAKGFKAGSFWSGSSTGDQADDFCTFTATPMGREDLPVNCINYDTARAFCQAKGADLPTEAQFEYVASGLEGKRYVWGDDAPSLAPAGCSEAVLDRAGWGAYGGMWAANACKPKSAPGGVEVVGSKMDPPRRDRLVLGSKSIFDLVGNVAELTLDKWQRQDEPCWIGGGAFSDPLCKSAIFMGVTDFSHVVIRGGSWENYPSLSEAAYRTYAEFGGVLGLPDVGFRCVRSGG
jgi:formylglycine-generating enzyme required for sulfatase activity